MGRRRKGKNKGFQWVREDQDDEAIEFVDRVTHREIREEDASVDAVVQRILDCVPSKRAQLPISATFVDALAEADRLSGPALSRHRRRLKRLARGEDLDEVVEALDGSTDAEVRLVALERWRTRMLDDGDAAIQAFVEEHDDTDRQALRSLVRQAKGTGGAAERAHKRLFQVLKTATPRPDTAGDD